LSRGGEFIKSLTTRNPPSNMTYLLIFWGGEHLSNCCQRFTYLTAIRKKTRIPLLIPNTYTYSLEILVFQSLCFFLFYHTSISRSSVAVRRAVLQCVAVCCSVLQCVAVCCKRSDNDSKYWTCKHTHTSSLLRQLQCVAVCCNMLHRVAVHRR